LISTKLKRALSPEHRISLIFGNEVERNKLTDLIEVDLINFSEGETHIRASAKGRVLLNELVLRVSESLVEL